MAISNYLFSHTSENPRGFSVWCVLAKFRAKPRNEIIHKHVLRNLKRTLCLTEN